MKVILIQVIVNLFSQYFAKDYRQGYVQDYRQGYVQDYRQGYVQDYRQGYVQDYRQGYAREIIGFRNYITTDDNNTRLRVHSLIECLLLCLDVPRCNSVLINEGIEICITSERTSHFDVPREPQYGWRNYRIQADSAKRCPEQIGFVFSWELDFCYKYFPKTGKQYETAVESCGMYNGSLARINSAERQKEMEIYLESFADGEVRIQGKYNVTQDQWLYQQGEIMLYFNWNSEGNQPNNHITETTLIMRKTQQYRWHDVRVDEIYAYVCEIPPPIKDEDL